MIGSFRSFAGDFVQSGPKAMNMGVKFIENT
jgi:hypothetical protein